MTSPTIPEQEEKLLSTVHRSLSAAQSAPKLEESTRDYHKELIELRDAIAEARLEDVPPLVEQMERLSAVAARRAEGKPPPVDPSAPYFAHLRLSEDGKERDVLIGKTTFIDARANVRIVDWRHAPVSQLYYRYPEGALYDEQFGDREVSGEVLVRRTVTIDEGKLLRVQAPQGIYVKRNEDWRELGTRSIELAGGQGSAARPDTVAKGTLGTGGDGLQRADRHLPEIAALLDPRQFELISSKSAGVVVIQGGAGSGKTTIGLHRMAYLAFREPQRFAADKMLVITYGPALKAYISAVLPALGVGGVKVETFQDWSESLRKIAVPWLEAVYEDDTPSAVSALKKHPATHRLLVARAKAHLAKERAARNSRAIVQIWAETLTDLPALRAAMADDPVPLLERDLTIAHKWCSDRCVAVLEHDPRNYELPEEDGVERDPDDIDPDVGVDGQRIEEDLAKLDREDDALFLRLHQLVIGPLKRARGTVTYEHIFVDEAQDLAPVELAVLLATASGNKSVTLAGDTAQKLYMENGFRDWRSVLGELELGATEIEPLRIAYRSTREVLEVAREVLGPLADPEKPVAPRSGAPVEAHTFPQQGAAVAFLAEALRPLFAREPRATVGILARYPEQADAYFEGLKRAEVPNLRRVRVQDFSFKPGVDVTEIKQVKGLEFDYVVLVDVNHAVFPVNDEARHLLHIGATRAAHQLWIVTSGKPSALVPSRLLDG